MNIAIISGYVAEPQFRVTTNGTAVMNVRLATREWSKEEGEHAEWHNVVIWAKQAEGLNKVLIKGSWLSVQGRLQTRKWQDANGVDKYTTEVVAFSTELGPKQTHGVQHAAGRPAQEQRRPPPAPARQRPAAPQQDWVTQEPTQFDPPSANAGDESEDPFLRYQG